MDSKPVFNIIKWDDHKNEIINQQKYLYENNFDCDCELISGNGKVIPVHQIVLSSSSEYFRKIISELPLNVTPTIHIPDADTVILEAIVKFIYIGETNIDSSNLTILLELCNMLDIKGCVANGFTLNGTNMKVKNDSSKDGQDSWTNEEYLVTASESQSDEECQEPDYLEEYLEDESINTPFEQSTDDDLDGKEFPVNQFTFDNEENVNVKSNGDKPKQTLRTRSKNADIEKALNGIIMGKTIHRLSVEHNLPRSTLYHRFRNDEHLKQNYRLERKNALDNAVRAVLYDRLSLKSAADQFQLSKTAIWREVRKCDQYQPSYKEITMERQNAQQEILAGKSLTSISIKYGIPLTTLHRDKKKLSAEGKLPESFRVKDRTGNSEFGKRLEMALKKCRNGMSQYQAAKLFGIPKATMWRYANALNKSNRNTNSTQNEQTE